MDNKITGKQSLNNLHKIFKTKHWKNYYKKLSEITKKYNKNKLKIEKNNINIRKGKSICL